MICPHCGLAGYFTQHPILSFYGRRNIKGYLIQNEFAILDQDLKITAPKDLCGFFNIEDACLWRCAGCGGFVIDIRGKTCYPTGTNIQPNKYMPEEAQNLFREAQSIFNLSPRATCALLRSCLEKMVDARNAQGKTLAQKLGSLNLSPQLLAFANLCRLYGNDAVHGGTIDFSVDNKEALAIAEALSTFINKFSDEIFGTEAIARELEEKIAASHS